jgi:hypothetical protein
MRRGLAAAATAIALGVASQASAQGAFQDFCVKTDAQMPTATAAADAAGWATIPNTELASPSTPQFTFSDYAVRLRRGDGTVQILIVGKGVGSSDGVQLPADMCLVVEKPINTAAVDAARAWSGVAPLLTNPSQGVEVYAFRDGAQGHVATKPGAAGDRELLAGRVSMVVISIRPSDDISTLGYLRFHRRVGAALGPLPSKVPGPGLDVSGLPADAKPPLLAALPGLALPSVEIARKAAVKEFDFLRH